MASDLATVLRRLALEPGFLAAVLDDPRSALAPHRLSGEDLAALALWLDRRHPAHEVRDLFETEPRSGSGDDGPADCPT